jgi:hypothetical protein
MSPFNLIKAKDFQAIPRSRVNHNGVWLWEEFMKKYNCERVCEIGVRNGQNFKLMIKHSPKEAVAIDPWIEDGILGRNDMCYPQEAMDVQYNQFKEDMKDLSFVKTIRDYSFNVAKQFPDEYFDFIYIDADHTFEGCYQDIKDWYPKVKKDGVLCGHDYNHRIAKTKKGHLTFGVVEAVRKYCKENKIEKFILKPIVWGMIKQ